MAQHYVKSQFNLSITDFLARAKEAKNFTSSNGKRYRVIRFDSDVMIFKRLDAKKNHEWEMDLREVYRAYKELSDYSTVNFKPYVPITHSPARGLLIHLGMLE